MGTPIPEGLRQDLPCHTVIGLMRVSAQSQRPAVLIPRVTRAVAENRLAVPDVILPFVGHPHTVVANGDENRAIHGRQLRCWHASLESPHDPHTKTIDLHMPFCYRHRPSRRVTTGRPVFRARDEGYGAGSMWTAEDDGFDESHSSRLAPAGCGDFPGRPLVRRP